MHFDALIIGAGFAGIYQLHRLRDGLGLKARLLEAGGDLGGTWYWNRYPGARCDSESHAYRYFFSRELADEWVSSERYPGPAEIRAYLEHVARNFDLRRDMQFDTRVTAARYARHCAGIAERGYEGFVLDRGRAVAAAAPVAQAGV